MMTRRLLQIVSTFAASVAVAVGGAEVVLRLTGMVPGASVATVNQRDFDRVPGMFEPGVSLIDQRMATLPHRVTIDSLGFRGASFDRRKRAGERRLLMVGDSFTFGDFVDDSATMPAALERELRRTCPAVRVVNAGLPGSTITEQSPVATRALDVAPDAVLLMFSENDITDLRAEPLWQELERNRTAKSTFPLSVAYPVLRRSAIWHLMLRVRGAARTRAQHGGRMPDEAPPKEALTQPASVGTGPPPDPTLRSKYQAALVQLRDTLAARGVPLLMTEFPAHHTTYRRWPHDQLDWVRQTAAALGIPYLATLEALQQDGRGETDLYLLPHDGHASAAGYLVAAKRIEPDLRRSLRWDCTAP